MATAKEGGKPKCSNSLGSEEYFDLECQPCKLDGKVQEAVGQCTDCQEYLCKRCFDVHTLPTPMRIHKLLNKTQMVQRQMTLANGDKCSEKCALHEDRFIKYYCTDHCQLSCNECVTLNHRSCDNVTFIPHAVKDLDNNDEYRHIERLFCLLVKRANKVTEDSKHKTGSLERSCSDAVKKVQEFRKEINEALDKIETDFISKLNDMKSYELKAMTQLAEDFKTVHADLNSIKAMTETYQNNKQNCNLYTLMMKAKETLMLAEVRIIEAVKEQSSVNSQIKFVPNMETLLLLKSSESFGKLSKSEALTVINEQTKTPIRHKETTAVVNRSKPCTIVRAEYVEDINVKSRSDERACFVTGLMALPGNRLLVVDHDDIDSGNGNVKLVDMNQRQVITQLTLSSDPWDVAMVSNSQVAVTLPGDEKVAIVSVASSKLTVDRTLDVSGECHGVDFRDCNLVVSFCYPDKVQILTLQGRVLYTITNDNIGQHLLIYPNYVAFDKNNKSLYISNSGGNNVVHVKFDGTVLDTYTYTNSELHRPLALLTDSSGDVYVCGQFSQNICQITQDCRNSQVLLTRADGLISPHSISFNEAESRMYVGMVDNNVKVYRVIRSSK